MRSPRYARMSLAAVLCAVSVLALTPTAAAETEEIAPGVYRLSGIEDDLPQSELQPLAAILADAEVVGLGEAIHGTRGFSRAKLRLFKYLVERAGFRVFGFESPWIDAERVARYVATCEGDPARAMDGLLGVWRNESVLALVDWMCEYNRLHPDDPLSFYGFDHQQGWNDAPALQEFLVAFGIAETNHRVRGLDDCAGATAAGSAEYLASREAPVRLDEHLSCMNALERGWRFLDRRARRLVRAGQISAEDVAWAKIHLVGLRAWQEQMFYFESDPPRSFEARDAGMAYIAQEIRDLRFAGAKTALWAHNAHLAASGRFLPETLDMGFFLREDLGPRYEAIGLVALQTEIDWPGVGCGPAQINGAGTLEALLGGLDEPYLLIDLAFPGARDPLFDAGGEQVVNGNRIVPREEFRALLYMDRAEAMAPVGRAACR